MEAIVAQLESPFFWIMTVVVGTLVGVLGNYATRLIDKSGNSASVWLRKRSQRRSARRMKRLAKFSQWLDESDNGAILAKLQSITFRMHAVLTSIGAISCFAFGYSISPKPRFSEVGLLFFVLGFLLVVLVAAFIKLADDLDRIVAVHPKGLGTFPFTSTY